MGENIEAYDTKNTYIHSSNEKKCLVIGCEGLVIVDTDDSLLVLNKAR